MRSALRNSSPRSRLLVAAAAGAALLALVSYASGALNALERSSVDTRFAIRGTKPPDAGIVIVALDGQSVNQLDQRPPIPRAYYARLLDRLHAAAPRLIAVDVEFNEKTDRADDNALLQAVARDGPVLLATEDTSSGTNVVPAGVKNAKGAVPASAAVDVDSDGVIRRMMFAPVRLETFAVKAAELLRQRAVSPAEFPDNHAWIDFRGPPGTFPTYSFADVLDGKVPNRVFSGKAVLVGVTDPLQKDVFVTPESSDPMAGVEVQANALSTILSGFPLKSANGTLEVVLLIALAALPAVLSARLAGLYGLLVCVLVLVLFLFGVQLAFDRGSIVDVPDPILALVLGCAAAISVESFVERRYRRALEQALGPFHSQGAQFFISYRQSQSRWPARILGNALVRKFGKASVFIDRDSIDAGQIWPRRIEEAIATCSVLLVVIGPDWLEARAEDGTRKLDDPGDWVRKEIEAGLAREEAVVVPVLLDGANVPTEEQLPDPLKPLAHCLAISLAGEDPDAEIDQLVDSIEMGRIREYFLRRAGTAPHGSD